MNFFFETLKCCFMPMYSHYIKNVSCSVVKHLYSRQLRYFFNENCSYETVKNLKPIRFFVIFRRFVFCKDCWRSVKSRWNRWKLSLSLFAFWWIAVRHSNEAFDAGFANVFDHLFVSCIILFAERTVVNNCFFAVALYRSIVYAGKTNSFADAARSIFTHSCCVQNAKMSLCQVTRCFQAKLTKFRMKIVSRWICGSRPIVTVALLALQCTVLRRFFVSASRSSRWIWSRWVLKTRVEVDECDRFLK